MVAQMRQAQLHTLQRQDATLLQAKSRLKADLASLHEALQREQAMLKSVSVQRDADLQRVNLLASQLHALRDREQIANRDPEVTGQEVADLQRQNDEMQKAIDEVFSKRAGF
jgi:chromosome segregation ATPase